MPRRTAAEPTGLTLKGVCFNILALLRARREHPHLCTVHDTRYGVSRYLRVFGDRLASERRGNFYHSRRTLSAGTGRFTQDHALPVLVKEQVLSQLPDQRLEPTEENLARLEAQLIPLTHIVQITLEENQALSDAGFRDCMPAEYYDPGSELYGDVFARYKLTQTGDDRGQPTSLFSFVTPGRLTSVSREGRQSFRVVICDTHSAARAVPDAGSGINT